MALGLNTMKLRVLILTEAFIVDGIINIPANMRFSDALNKFMRDRTFLAVTDAEIRPIKGDTEPMKKDFILVNRDLVIGISPSE